MLLSAGAAAAKGPEIALCAPTGRAAKRLAETTGARRRPSTACSSPTRSSGGFKHNRAPARVDLLVVDETSMVDVPLHGAAEGAARGRRPVLVGDVDQLPPVGPGHVLRDLIDSGVFPVVPPDGGVPPGRRQPHRHQRPPRSTRARCRSCKPRGGARHFYFVEAADPETGMEKLLAMVRDRIPRRFGLAPGARRPGALPDEPRRAGARSLNIALQEALNPPGEVRGGALGWTFRPRRQGHAGGQRLRHATSSTATSASSAGSTWKTASWWWTSRAGIAYGFGELDELVLAYATTVHKCQGWSTRRW